MKSHTSVFGWVYRTVLVSGDSGGDAVSDGQKILIPTIAAKTKTTAPAIIFICNVFIMFLALLASRLRMFNYTGFFEFELLTFYQEPCTCNISFHWPKYLSLPCGAEPVVQVEISICTIITAVLREYLAIGACTLTCFHSDVVFEGLTAGILVGAASTEPFLNRSAWYHRKMSKHPSFYLGPSQLRRI